MSDQGAPVKRSSWLKFVLGQSRGPRNAITRLPTILGRFGMTPAKSVGQLNALLDVTGRYAITPTLLVTAVTAQRNPEVIRRLQARGVEIGAHGYVHNDYSALTAGEQLEQVGRARNLLASLGIETTGWRCPYSRWNVDTVRAVARAGFDYEATPVYEWPAFEQEGIVMSSEARADYERLCRLFGVRSARHRAVLPEMVDGLVQIPMSIPQDEDMIDRLHLSNADLRRVWLRMLSESRSFGETFVICLHPERAQLMSDALGATLAEARRLGDVWTVPLREISRWWRDRATASVRVSGDTGAWRVNVTGPDRVVVRYGDHQLIGSGEIAVEPGRKPVVGYGKGWPEETLRRITEAGFIVERATTEEVMVHLDDAFPATTHPEEVVRRLAGMPELVRLQPWPAGFRSCLSVTGDIDALTLFDFAMRLKEFS